MIHPCLGCEHCGIYTTNQTLDGSVYHTVDCLHFKQLLRMPDMHTKFYCRYFDERK